MADTHSITDNDHPPHQCLLKTRAPSAAQQPRQLSFSIDLLKLAYSYTRALVELTLAQETVNGLQLTLAQDTVNEMQMQLAFA